MLFTIAAFSIAPHHRTLQAYLAAVEPGTYMHCLYNGDELINSTTFPEMEYPLGNPTGPATEKVKIPPAARILRSEHQCISCKISLVSRCFPTI